ncbi:MAG: PepSY-associated TM helix domain-containing protein [Pseudomonadota bacterium]
MAETKPKSSAIRVARSLEAHSLVAVVFGALIYILAVTGTLSVFNHEFQRWERPDIPEMASISPEAAEKAALTVFESEETPTTHLYINFPMADLPRTVITTDTQAFYANAEGTIAGPEEFVWTQFVLDLHYYLHFNEISALGLLASVVGLTLVGALGALLLGLSFSGLLAHPRIFRDAFTFRRSAGRLTTVDMHNRLSVWTLPFHFTNALTGSILGLASILALVIAAVGFNNDTGAVFEPIFGGEPDPVEGEASVADIAGPLHYMAREYPDLAPTYFILHDPGTAGQHSTVIAEHSDRLIFGEYYNFTAAGDYEGNVGISDGTVGQQLTGAVYNVHFGNWGGLPVKLAYLGFGIGLCVIVASGLSLYFAKREINGRPAPRLAAMWSAIVWGTPALLAVMLIAAMLGWEGGALASLFWISLAIVLGGASRSTARAVKPVCQLATGIALILALSIYVSRYGSLAVSDAGMSITLVIAATALGFLAWALLPYIGQSPKASSDGSLSYEPAE